MPRLAIVAALEREVRPLVKSWRITEKEYDGRRFRFFENGDIVVVCGGIGAVAARRASEAVIAIFDPKVLCSAGFAGALDSRLKVGDLIRPSTVINAGDSSRTVVDGGEGVLVSFGSVASPAQKRKLRESYGAEAVDMEAATVARAAEVRGKLFTAVKAVSDEMDFEFPAMERFVDAEGEFSQGRFACYAAIRPWLWPRVTRLALNSSRASRALCAYLGTITA
ncbi:MAG: phosphorylase [Acidobacteriia bacterium]|nr:phosphorylase [Terriglobia bacterium]